MTAGTGAAAVTAVTLAQFATQLRTIEYFVPTPDDLKDRYPAFANVADETIYTWLAEAAEECAIWPEEVRARAEMLYAAHWMVEARALTGTAFETVPTCVTSFKSGVFAATVDGGVAARTGFDATAYGREFVILRRQHFGGSFLAGYVCA